MSNSPPYATKSNVPGGSNGGVSGSGEGGQGGSSWVDGLGEGDKGGGGGKGGEVEGGGGEDGRAGEKGEGGEDDREDDDESAEPCERVESQVTSKVTAITASSTIATKVNAKRPAHVRFMSCPLLDGDDLTASSSSNVATLVLSVVICAVLLSTSFGRLLCLKGMRSLLPTSTVPATGCMSDHGITCFGALLSDEVGPAASPTNSVPVSDSMFVPPVAGSDVK